MECNPVKFLKTILSPHNKISANGLKLRFLSFIKNCSKMNGLLIENDYIRDKASSIFKTKRSKKTSSFY